MSIVLDLPQELENELATEATHLGVSLTEYVLRLLSTRSLVGQLPTTGAELVAYWQREGVIGTRREITDSQAHARQIRHQAERRLRE
jgi:tryptophan synthase alpha subunit